MTSTLDRFRGCLLGGAVGDALGAPVEFSKRPQILERFGPLGITRYAPAYGRLGAITDDTQMTLFTAEGLLRGLVRGALKGITTYPGVTSHAYLRWLVTQGGVPEPTVSVSMNGWLIGHRELFARRAPGKTCLTALVRCARFGDAAENDSKGCGGVMRVAPVGLFVWEPSGAQQPDEAFRLAADIAGLTHGHPTGKLASGFFAALLPRLLDGAALTEALADAHAVLPKTPEAEETRRAVRLAEDLAGTDLQPHEAIARLGQGWIAEEALAIGIYAALAAPSFDEAVILAVNHDGDSDSTGSLAGQLRGAMEGVGAIGKHFLRELELRDVIDELARDLYEYREWQIGESPEMRTETDRLFAKYPGG